MAVVPLRALHAARYQVALVVTRPDKRRGRGSTETPSPVKAAAIDLGLPVSHRVDDVIGTGADLGVVVAFGRLIKPPVLAAIPMVNVHFSLLPRWRGAAPVERAILAGDTETGVALMELEEGLDTGPVLAQRVFPIGEDTTAAELRHVLTAAGTELLLDQLSRGLTPGTPQQGEATYAAKIEPGELRLDWSQPARQIHRVIRIGRAWTTFRGRRLAILEATVPATAAGTARAGAAGTAGELGGTAGELGGTAGELGGAAGELGGAAGELGGAAGELRRLVVCCGEGVLELVEVQPEGRAAMPVQAWANGARPHPGECLV